MKAKRAITVEIAPRIAVDPQVRFGQPVIKGTRVPVAVVLDEMAAGTTMEEITREYGITRDDVRAVFRYAAKLLSAEEVKVASR